MKFIVSTTTLLKCLQTIAGVIKGGSVLPILDDFLFDLRKNELTVFATDLNISMSNTLRVESSDNGRIAIPGRLLLDTLKSLPEQPLVFKIDVRSMAIEIASETGRYKLIGENAEDFPKPTIKDKSNKVAIPAGVLSNALSKTLFAVSNDDLRPAMTGVLFEFLTTGVNFVSTDAHKLVKVSRSDIQAEKDAQLIIPKKAVSLLKAALPTSDEPVAVEYNKVNAFFSFGTVNLICRLVDANYPAYGAVIPNNNPGLLQISRLELLSSMKRISLYSNHTTYQAILAVDGSELKVSSSDLDDSKEAKESLTCSYSGEDMAIAFNARYLIEALGVMDAMDVEVELSTPARAAIFRPSENNENESLIILLMPVQING